MNRLSLGDCTITWLNGGNFELDGGTMYGAVPKALWTKKFPADENNYITLLNAPLLIQTGEFNLIVDTGLGNKLTDKQREIFRVSEPWTLPADLEKLGIQRQDIHYVVLTHGDFDHAGGIVMHDEKGKPELTFPAAKHIIQSLEWQDITHPNSRAAHTYWKENFFGLQSGSSLFLQS